jgi:hypothetical protein
MPKGFWERLSKLIAWFGFLSLLFWAYVGPTYGIGVMWWLAIGAFNYLLVGSMRLVPWWDIKD